MSDSAQFLASETGPQRDLGALFHIFPVGYEQSTSYGGGTKQGPKAILDASSQLEAWDGKTNTTKTGIYTNPESQYKGMDRQSLVDEISAQAEAFAPLMPKSIPVVIGGEHTVTYAFLKGLIEGGIDDFGVVQIDAHADLRDRYEGSPLSHACAMRRVIDLGIPLYQLGVRAISEPEVHFRKEKKIGFKDAIDLVPGNIGEIQLPENFPKKVFFTVDIDGLDPSIFPSTGTPVPGGLGWYQTLSLFQSVAEQREIIGFDLVEFSPIKGFHAYEFAAAALIQQFMGILIRS